MSLETHLNSSEMLIKSHLNSFSLAVCVPNEEDGGKVVVLVRASGMTGGKRLKRQ